MGEKAATAEQLSHFKTLPNDHSAGGGTAVIQREREPIGVEGKNLITASISLAGCNQPSRSKYDYS